MKRFSPGAPSDSMLIFAGLLVLLTFNGLQSVAAVPDPTTSTAVPVALIHPTATFSQILSGDFSVAKAVDGIQADSLGWAIQGAIQSQTAVFQTAADVGSPEGTLLSFSLTQVFLAYPPHTLGHFRLSITSDDRTTYADGKPRGGNVDAHWTVLQPIFAQSANGATLTALPDGSILASGKAPETDTYLVRALTDRMGITGIRLEALTDPSLPFGGPGRAPLNGNFVLSEFRMSVEAVPEPSVLAVVLLGLFGLARNVSMRKK